MLSFRSAHLFFRDVARDLTDDFGKFSGNAAFGRMTVSAFRSTSLSFLEKSRSGT